MNTIQSLYKKACEAIILAHQSSSYFAHGLTSGMMTKAARRRASTRLRPSTQRRKVKYEATADPKWDSIVLMRPCHASNPLTHTYAAHSPARTTCNDGTHQIITNGIFCLEVSYVE